MRLCIFTTVVFVCLCSVGLFMELYHILLSQTTFTSRTRDYLRWHLVDIIESHSGSALSILGVRIFMSDGSCFLPSLSLIHILHKSLLWVSMGPIPQLEIHPVRRSNTYTSQKTSLHLRQAFLEILFLPPAGVLRMALEPPLQSPKVWGGRHHPPLSSRLTGINI